MTYQLFAIGNALVDQEFYIDDALLSEANLQKGTMALASLTEQIALTTQLSKRFQPESMTSGGSAANTAFTFSGLGGKAFYACRVGKDALGEFYLSDLQKAHVATAPLSKTEGTTGTCVVMVTPDAQRTMQTSLGISAELTLAQVDVEALKQSQYLYIEGYLATNPDAVLAVQALKEIAQQHNIQTVLTLSDPAMIQFARAGLDGLLQGGIDMLFCNHDEAMAYTGLSDLEQVTEALQQISRHVIITCSGDGVIILKDGHKTVVPSVNVETVTNTNGAGDAFAGAYLFGVAKQQPVESCAKLAHSVASQVIQCQGARLAFKRYSEFVTS